ncbi:tetratricopeptide repeat protein [Pseudomonas fluorescens]|uniref:Beta-barrel assembly-enhancing protease n=1 Tax=Pseudomonas fluorescens TaxID=294 RepID=A0A5E7FB23_PSEFL|nr:tetratricopeptide repeat protein [Pseudomonas fluorescens]VVO34723.1 Beta-barrel assembly-enhancing protease [Pseudomonas fluorescens]
MSLVNDMLRDLERRRAAPSERPRLDGLVAVDEADNARRFRRLRIIVGGLILIMLIGVLAGLLIHRLVKSVAPPQVATIAPVVPVTPVTSQSAPSLAPAHMMEVLPRHDDHGLVLQLLLDRSATYQRRDESGSVALIFPGVQLSTALGAEQPQGRLERDGHSLSWRVQALNQGVQVLLTGLGDNLQVRDRLEASGDHWRLWIEVPMATKTATPDAADTPMGMEEPLAETPAVDPASAEEPLPAWAYAPVPTADQEPRPAPAAPRVKPPVASGPPQMNITTYQPDALTLALQTLQNGDYPRAIRELNALLASRGNDVDVVRGLARAYLADGQQSLLLTWLPPRLKQWPNDSELRLLLARAQLQSGNARGAVATLEQNAPPLAQDLIYHALLAACYQQTEQWPQSVALYEQMIKLRPGQAAWQLGLAIALERLDRSARAAVHYRLAEQGQGLDDGARRFASDRALALGSR